MKCCIVGSWKSGSTSTYLSLSLNVKYHQIRDKSVLTIRSVMGDFVSWFCAVKKWILKKLVGELETMVRFQKNNVFSPLLFTIFAKAVIIDLPVLFFSDSAHTRKTFQQQSTWTRDRLWAFSHLASQSNQLAIDHQRRWPQCDDIGNYDEQADAKSAVMHSPLVASAYNFIKLQTCDVSFSSFWKVKTESERCS